MSSHFGLGTKLSDNTFDQSGSMGALERCYESIKEERLKLIL